MNLHISDSIKYVGVDDPTAQIFERQYPLAHGMSYNSYVIVDDKIAVTDSVEAASGAQWIRQIEEATARRTPDYLVVHHMEPDHSACITEAMERWPELTLVASAKAIAMLPQFFPTADLASRTLAIKEGDTLPLGTHTLRFLSAPMIHWPEVMMSYESTEQVLFSADAFGKFGCIQYADDWANEARRYYINIVGKYGRQVQSLLQKLASTPVSTIAPLHGPILSGNLAPYIKLYDTWSRYQPETQGTLVAYASIYGGTADAARLMAEMLRTRHGGDITVMDLTMCDMSEAVAQAFRLSSMVICAPTYDAGLYPAMHDFLYHLGIKGYRNRRVGIVENGSWAPIAAKLMRNMLEPLPEITVVDPTVTIRSRLNDQSIDALTELAEAITRPETN